MTASIQVVLPSNGLVIDGFSIDGFYYQLPNGTQFPIFKVDCAWCLQCEEFVPLEVLYPIEEIERKIQVLLDCRDRWSKIDAESVAEWQERSKSDSEPPAYYFKKHWHEKWVTALEWRRNRQSKPRCLVCGSMFGVKRLPVDQSIPHPTDDRVIEVRVDVVLISREAPFLNFEKLFDGEGNFIQEIITQLGVRIEE